MLSFKRHSQCFSRFLLYRGLLHVFLGMLFFLASLNVMAHKPSTSYMQMVQLQHGFSTIWHIPIRELNYVFDLDIDSDHRVTWGELLKKSREIKAYAKSSFQVYGDETPCLYGNMAFEVEALSDGAYLVLSFLLDCVPSLVSLDMNYSLFHNYDPLHRGVLKLELEDASYPISFSEAQPQRSLAVASLSLLPFVSKYLREGILHILAGLDHILFVFCLVFSHLLRGSVRLNSDIDVDEGRRQRYITFLKVISMFTLGHSLSLLVATFDWVSISSRIVESTIAASVFIAALNNVFRFIRRWELTIIFAFGLVHGLGFAGVLQEIDLPLFELVLSLLFFNIGIELGQIIIVLSLVPLLYFLNYLPLIRAKVNLVGSVAISCLALVWFIERAFLNT